MNPSDQVHDPLLDEQASLWAARLEGSPLSAADRGALDAWLNENPAHRALLSQYCQFSADLEEQLPVLVAAGTVAMPAGPQQARRAGFRWAAAAVLAAAAAVAFAVWVARPAGRVENIATTAAQRQAFTLADGTRVELNARTSLRMDFGRQERHVRLAEGEAFFTVSKDPARPFFVETPAGSVRVTGTVFNVRSEAAAELVVTVVEGSVQVRPGETDRANASAPELLGAGDQLTVRDGRVSRALLTGSSLDAALAWRQGMIVFNGDTLQAALARYAHYHGCSLTPSAGAAGMKVTGFYKLDDLDGFLGQLEANLPVRVVHEPRGAFRVCLRNEP